MPNRMLRPWLNSDKVNILTVHAERFFTRLIMVVDDYGCFYADTRLLKANMFPLLLDNIREADLSRWMDECQKAGLIVLYEVNSKKYVQILDFRQRLDKAKSKYPQPVNEVPEIVTDFPAELEGKREVEEKGKGTISHPLKNSNLFRKPNIPTMERVDEIFITMGGTKEMADRFFKKHDSVGWFLNGSPITNFANLVPGFITNWNRNNKDAAPVYNGQQSAREKNDESLLEEFFNATAKK